MNLQLFSNQTLKKEVVKSSDSTVCLDMYEMRIVNGAFIDLDDCEQENISLKKIIVSQDTIIKSKIELQDLYKKQNDYNEDLKYQLTASINTQIQRFNVFESAYKQQSKQQKKRSIITGGTIGIGLAVTLAIVIFKVLK